MSKQKKRESQLFSHMAWLPAPSHPTLLRSSEGGLEPQPGAVGVASSGPELTSDWTVRVPVISDHHDNIMCVCQEAENLRKEMHSNPGHILARQWLKGTGVETFLKLKPVSQVCLDGWFVGSTPREKGPENICVLSRGKAKSQAEHFLGLFYGCIFGLGPWQEAPLSHNRTVQPS